MDKWLEKEIKKASKNLENRYMLTPAEYSDLYAADIDVKGHESAFMLGGMQAMAKELLFWLGKAGLVDDNSAGS